MHPAEKNRQEVASMPCWSPPTYSDSPNHHRRRRRASRRWSEESAYQVWRSPVGVKLCVHAMLNYRLLPLEDGGNLHLIGDHGVYQFA
jgi:hypothetical protein